MSWSQWPVNTPGTAWPQSVIAPPVAPVAAPTAPINNPGGSYTPEQWASLQQQNWQQWMQWQQQYQQWQQQYGEQVSNII